MKQSSLGLILTTVVLLTCSHIAAVRNTSFQWFRNRTGYKDVKIESGVVRGAVSSDGDYVEFLGVPYAAPPTGDLRFKAPVPAYSWNGVYEADRIVMCPQKGDGVEDCLVVNIFTPKTTPSDELLPVFVYFHGGSFVMGSGQVEGVKPLIRQNIIVVTVNYRLGALGFLCLGIEEAPGNAGLKDQVAALQWIQRNIHGFGGDSNRVTIYGMSAGGASVELLVLSPKAKGLFRQAIVESGSATSVWTMDFDPVNTALKVAKLLNFSSFQKNKFLTKSLANYYKRVHARRLSFANFEYYNNLIDGSFGFVPCIEKVLTDNKTAALITESPYKILTREKYEKVPMMFLYAAVEGLFLRSQEYYIANYQERMSENFLDFLPRDLEFDSPEIRKAVGENVKEFYFGNKTIGEDIGEYLNYFGDYLILHGLLNSAEIHSRNDNPVYLMEFAYKGNMGSHEKFYANISLAGHGDVIKHVILNKQPQNVRDKTAVARVSRMIGNFVKYGNPIPNRTKILPILWPRVRPGNVSCLRMDDYFRVVDEPHWDAKEFWDTIYDKFRKQLYWKDHNDLY